MLLPFNWADRWLGILNNYSDACLVIPTLPQNIGRLTNNPEISQITDTCWNQTGNLFTGLGLDKEIKVDGIDFSEFNTLK